MGNTTSTGSSSNASNSATQSQCTQHSLAQSLPLFRRSTGLLGLSKNELDRRSKPSGIYSTTLWDERVIRRLIGDGKLASRVVGTESEVNSVSHECPICFLYYSEINITTCCRAHICTECYLQVQPQKEKGKGCPFCNNEKFDVRMTRTVEGSVEEQTDCNEKECAKCPPEDVSQVKAKVVNETAFGSSLERHVRLRSDSIASENSSETSAVQLMSAEERGALEEEMKQQHNHPLAKKMMSEAEERRNQNDLQYRRSNGRMRSTRAAALLHRNLVHGRRGRGPRRERDWNQIAEAFESDVGSEGQSLEDLVFIEAAILLSMEEEAQRRRTRGEGSNDDQENRARSLRQPGFSLYHALMSRRMEDNGDEDDEDDRARRLRRRRTLENLTGGAMGTAANLFVRGPSEEEQIAMAIANSLRDKNENEDSTTESSSSNCEEAAANGNGQDANSECEGRGSGSISSSP